MINPNELRIGSLVNYEQTTHRILTLGQTTCESICINSKSHLDTYERPYKEYAPIPLTEEWLERFGFTYEGRTYMGLDEFTNQGFIVLREQDQYMFCYENANGDYVDLEIETVHQLQNLYFALTEEEPKAV